MDFDNDLFFTNADHRKKKYTKPLIQRKKHILRNLL